MPRFRYPGLAAGLLVLIAAISGLSTAEAAAQRDPNQGSIASQPLYNASDSVVVLNVANFKSSVYGDTRGWLVEFYNSWCGFCARFAPTWKALAADIRHWRDIVVVAAIDCADDDNNPTCREYEIMHYPMIKYFPVNAHPSSLGIEVPKGDTVNDVRHNLLERLEKEQQEGRGLTWPNITPYRNVELKHIWKAVPDTVKCFFLIFETADSHLGTEIILDLHTVAGVQIRRVTSDNSLLCVMNKITRFPSLVALGRNESQKLVNVRIPTREGIRNAIKEHARSKGVVITEEGGDNAAGGSLAKVSDSPNSSEPTPEQTDDYLYQLDLENTLRYSLNHEIPSSKFIVREKMDALRLYINVLTSYFPMRRSGVFLEVIRDILEKKESTTGEEFSQVVQSAEEQMYPVYSGPRQWIGCKGSSERFRGYPCGLWTMFHMLTVNFVLQNEAGSTPYDPTEVLRAMHGYIKHFFGCADCSNHFVEMAAKNKIFDAATGDESVAWLWRAHNEVNARLSGDDTEDPEHRKIQYPSGRQCPACRLKNGTWDEPRVLVYLKKKYGYAGINYTGSSEKHLDGGSKEKVRLERLAMLKHGRPKRLRWDFNFFDLSICVLLYVTSSAILILICIKFAVKRGYRKKGYFGMLGKV